MQNRDSKGKGFKRQYESYVSETELVGAHLERPFSTHKTYIHIG